jgi:hypothetical protein
LTPLSVGDIRGVTALWSEKEESDDQTAAAAAAAATAQTAPDSKRQAMLGMYQEIPDLTLYPGGVTSTRKVNTGVTTHRCFELLSKTDDLIEQSLLRRKTLIMSCSTDVHVPFEPAVLTEEEKKKEEEMYDRFFLDLTSFCQPASAVGAAPTMAHKQYKIAIVQSGTVVDEYSLPLGEHVLGLEPIYLTQEMTTTVPAVVPMAPQLSITKKIRRVYLAACTVVEDKHGEDTQGEGRLMVFGLDYAQFHDETTPVSATTVEEKQQEGAAESKTEGEGGAAVAAGTTTSAAAAVAAPSAQVIHIKTSAQQSAEQVKFLGSIQPKLKLLCTGPGPCSVVKQLGEYILTTVGSTIFIYKLNPETAELDQVAFHFAQVRWSFILRRCLPI